MNLTPSKLETFLDSDLEGPLQRKVLQLFYIEPNLILSTEEAAERLNCSQSAICHVIKELAALDLLIYCASFGNSDLCTMSTKQRARTKTTL